MGKEILNDAQRRELLLKDIEFMKGASFEQFKLILFSGIELHFKSLIKFGRNSNVTKESINVIRDMFKIMRIEGKLLDYIVKHIDVGNIGAMESAVDQLDVLNDKTYLAYDGILGEIEVALDLNDEKRALKSNQGIDSLLSNELYSCMIYALVENNNSIKDFLGYEDEFWEAIKTHLRIVPDVGKLVESNYGVVPIVDHNRCVVDMIVVVPTVVDLDSALLALDIYSKAHNYFINYGKNIDGIEKNYTSDRQEFIKKLNKRRSEK